VKLDRVLDTATAGQSKAVKPGVAKPAEAPLPKESFSLSSGPLEVGYTLPPDNPYKVTTNPSPGIQVAVPVVTDDADDDGPGVGGGYTPSYSMASAGLGDGLMWHTSDQPMQTQNTDPWDVDDTDGPGLGGGYFTRPFQATAQGALYQEFVPPDEGDPTGEISEKAPSQESASTAGPSSFQGVSALERIQAKFSSHPVALQRLELKAVDHYEKQFEDLKTAAQFQAHTSRLRDLAKNGAPLEELRPQAYALARVAAKASLGMRPYDSQVLGALSMDSGTVAQMGTGEGKTLTALMPLYLNALTGQGSHLITVNDYLAQAGFDDLKPAFEMLGMTTGLVLRDMPSDEKRAGYAADVTYLSNDTLGFDYLHDRTVKNPDDRVQRAPHFALIDEVDQVLLDEARVPLIIAGPQAEDEFAESVVQGKIFDQVVKGLVPGEDFRVDRKAHSAYLTEVGQLVVANEIGLLELSPDDPDFASKQAAGLKLRSVLRQEARLTEGETDLAPELKAQRGLKKVWSELLGRPTTTPEQVSLDEIRAQRDQLLAEFPGTNLYSEDQMYRVRFLQNALEARGLFREGYDYAVENGEVQIVDEFKGRISEGRRFTQGLHQALEIKEGLEAQPETRTLASITYPNLFRRYDRLAGMTGTAKSAEKEFNEVLGLNVVEVPPNKERQRVDHPTEIFATRQEKFEAVLNEARQLFEEGIPVLVATRSVEMNQYVSALLDSQGIPNQSLNAQDVKTNTPEENAIIQTAGKSGVVTVATNMAGRGVDIKPDPINYKKLAVACDEARRQGKPVLVNLEKPEHAQRLIEWFQLPSDPEHHVPFELVEPGQAPSTRPGQVSIVVGQDPADVGSEVTHLQGKDFPGKKLVVLATERNMDTRVDDQLRGRAGRQGAPGETRFYVSLEDDLMRIYSGQDRDKLVKMLENGGQDKVRQLVDQAQKSVENTHADARLSTTKYDQVANKQREIVWGFRDQWVDSRPDRVQVDGDAMDIQGTVNDWMVEAYTAALDKELGGKARPSQERMNQALEVVGKEFGFPVELTAGRGWKEQLDKTLRSKIDDLDQQIQQNAGPNLSPGLVKFYQWQTLLQNIDEGWIHQLQVLDDEKQGSNLEAYAGREPEEVYVERSFKAFDEMWNWVKAETARQVMPQMLMAADILVKQAANRK